MGLSNKSPELKITPVRTLSDGGEMLSSGLFVEPRFLSHIRSYKTFVDACLVANSVFSVINDNCFHGCASFQ